MQRTTIMLPPKLRAQAEQHARQKGVSLSEFIQELLSNVLQEQEVRRSEDPLFADNAVFDGEIPPDLSKNHDRYLYGDEL